MELGATVVAAACRVLAAFCVAVTALPLLPLKAWWVRCWDFPRQQIAVLGAIATVGLLLLHDTPWNLDLPLLLALLGALAYQLILILPYTPLWPYQGLATEGSVDERSLRLVIVNVLMSNRESDGLDRTLEETDPDLVLAIEADGWWVERLGDRLPGHPYRVLHPLDNTYGIALFSRLELLHPEVRFLLDPEIPSIRTRVRLPSGEDVLLIGVHPEPPSPTESETSLPRDAELVLVGREVAKEPKPVIVAGDLNDVAWSHTSRLFRRLSRLIDPRIGRGFCNSFHARWWWLRWPLDHVFYSPDFLLRDLRRLPAFGSDHFPILIELEYYPRAADIQNVADADHVDQREASTTVAEALSERTD
ncbi:endonuclease/exonuclease/phosphatase family protein [Benzoatithermus flavus]|uniref:Endonuclease/exonuclease/phosphatase family protein n=1 Tax=Benzoatithermus flavus TaxID=3108223 RepID=A0ABU8XPE3_9PROT